MITLILPWPPSVNHYWGQNGNRRYVKAKGVAFRKETADIVAANGQKIYGRLAVFISLYPPNKIRRDIDNHVKAVQDALQMAGCFDDDEQIDHLTVARMPVVKGGQCKVVLVRI